jgi:hypothetical protein
MIESFFAYGSQFLFHMDMMDKETDRRIEELKHEFFHETPKLPLKLKKKRRKELNGEYSFLVSIRQYKLNMFN